MKAILTPLAKNAPATALQVGRTPLPQQKTPTEVLIKVMATAVNRADILQRQGKYPPMPGVSEIIGLECSG